MPVTTLARLAELVGGRVIGDPDTQISNALPLQDATTGCITLADHAKHTKRLATSNAAAVLMMEEVPNCSLPMLLVENAHLAFRKIIVFFRPGRDSRLDGVHRSAEIDPSSTVGRGTAVASGVSIGPGCSIGERCVIHSGVHIMDDCTIGDDCILYPNAVLYEGTQVGARVLIHAGAVVGAFGFGYRLESGQHVRTAQLGWVELGDDVEIGANTTIDRGTYGATIIAKGTKIDNLVQIGHNCHIGEHNLICAQVGIAGSSSTGKHVVLAGQVGLADHVHLDDRVTVCGKSGIMNDVKAGEIMLGSPAVPRKQKMLEYAIHSKLPEMRRDLKDLHSQVKQLTAQLQRLTESSDPMELRDAA